MTPRSEHESYQSFPVFKAVGEQQKNWLERSLSVFADVRVGEAAGVLLLTLNAFLLLAGYYMLKTAREALILTQGGAEVKSYSSAGQALRSRSGQSRRKARATRAQRPSPSP